MHLSSESQVVDHGFPIFLWQSAMPIIVGCITGCMWGGSGMPNCINYFVTFTVYTWLTSVAMGHIM
jgi:hypothetical protein